MKRQARILLVEDDRSLAMSLVKVFTREGYDADCAVDGAGGIELARKFDYDVILSDQRLPDVDGLELVERLRDVRPGAPVIVFTAHGTAESAIEATKRGAYDFLLKPFAMPDLLSMIGRALSQSVPRSRGPSGLPHTGPDDAVIGQSRAMQEVFAAIGRIATQEVTVLITGETGTGKEMVARAIGSHSARRDRPFVTINCAAIPETLLESELFGHEKGAFTGATSRHIGRFEQADTGTIFLDEIGDLTAGAQVRLLRVLQEKRVERVGGAGSVAIDARVIAATRENLEEATRQGNFRDDLYYRLNVARIHVPPLRERTEDIPLLAAHFARRHTRVMGGGVGELSPGALRRLTRYSWPGNVRELENVVRRALIAARGYSINSEHIEDALSASTRAAFPDARTLPELVRSALRESERAGHGRAHATVIEAGETELLRQAMTAAGGNQSRAARWLGLSRLTLREKLQRYGLHPSGE